MSDFDFGLDGFKPAMERLDEEREQRLRFADRVMPFNVMFLDECLLGIYPTDLIVVCAATGAGKTSIAALIAQLATAQGRRVHFFALEAHKAEIEQRMLFREICNELRDRGVSTWGVTFARWMYGMTSKLVTEDVERAARERLLDDVATLRTFYRATRFSADDITRLFLAVQNETDLVVLDHLHYVDSDERDDNRGLRAITKSIRDAALDMEKPVIVVAHLRKKDSRKPRLVPDIDDVHGSSDIVKIATKVIMLAPARDQESRDSTLANTYMQAVKDRFQGTSGLVALLQYDMRTMRYLTGYRLGRLSFTGEEFKPLAPHEVPVWATSAVTETGEPAQLKLCATRPVARGTQP